MIKITKLVSTLAYISLVSTAPGYGAEEPKINEFLGRKVIEDSFILPDARAQKDEPKFVVSGGIKIFQEDDYEILPSDNPADEEYVILPDARAHEDDYEILPSDNSADEEKPFVLPNRKYTGPEYKPTSSIKNIQPKSRGNLKKN